MQSDAAFVSVRQAPPNSVLRTIADRHAAFIRHRTSGMRQTAVDRPPAAYAGTRPSSDIHGLEFVALKPPVRPKRHPRRVALRHVRARQAADVQLQAARVLPVVRYAAHVADNGAPGVLHGSIALTVGHRFVRSAEGPPPMLRPAHGRASAYAAPPHGLAVAADCGLHRLPDLGVPAGPPPAEPGGRWFARVAPRARRPHSLAGHGQRPGGRLPRRHRLLLALLFGNIKSAKP